jgi:hypothetical protein
VRQQDGMLTHKIMPACSLLFALEQGRTADGSGLSLMAAMNGNPSKKIYYSFDPAKTGKESIEWDG